MKYSSYYKIILLFIFSSSFCFHTFSETKEQQTKVNLREISHEFLMQLGDSTSRILPIQLTDGRYEISFEQSFSFEPDFLLFSVYKFYEKNKIPEQYIVEVEECYTKALVYSFNTGVMNTMACKRRGLPKNCYRIYFSEISNHKILEASELEKPLQTPKWMLILLLLLLLFGLSVVLIWVVKRKKTSENNALVKEIEAFEHIQKEEPEEFQPKTHTVEVGLYYFDKKNLMLHLKETSYELSAKESDLLTLFIANENTVLERDFILNKVWGDDGTYSGSTLDVYISKLRKKLEADSNLKIMNVRGVGYRFIKNE
ncbi:MAG: winged helix-turn-helix domain-containing protein [Flavobacteriales bacterium]